jgi:hypothetical protein
MPETSAHWSRWTLRILVVILVTLVVLGLLLPRLGSTGRMVQYQSDWVWVRVDPRAIPGEQIEIVRWTQADQPVGDFFIPSDMSVTPGSYAALYEIRVATHRHDALVWSFASLRAMPVESYSARPGVEPELDELAAHVAHWSAEIDGEVGQLLLNEYTALYQADPLIGRLLGSVPATTGSSSWGGFTKLSSDWVESVFVVSFFALAFVPGIIAAVIFVPPRAFFRPTESTAGDQVPRCLCGYDVRNLPDGSPCPECGTQPSARSSTTVFRSAS